MRSNLRWLTRYSKQCGELLSMGLETLHAGTGRTFSGQRHLLAPPALFKTLIWLWLISFVVAVKPNAAQEAPKGKATPPAAPLKRLTKSMVEASPMDNMERREYVVQRTKAGDTLHELLSRFGLSNSERELWTRSIERNIGIRRLLPAGKEVHFYFTKRTPGQRQAPQLKAMEVDLSDAATLAWEKGIRGILFQKREKPYDVELKTVSALVKNSLFEDGQKAGINPNLRSQLADIFAWDIDLERGIRKGDSVNILYEQRSRKSQEKKTALRILAAELISAGEKFTAIYFEKQKGQGNYYNLEGRSLARSFLRFPLELASITSQFAHARFHPILKVNVPHTGVDFAAKRGTPVRAVGDGGITLEDWIGVYCNIIVILLVLS